MPSGRTHELVNVAALATGYAAYSAFVGNPPADAAGAFSAGYLSGTFFLTPDMDLAESPTGTRALRGWGVLKYLWIPYGALFPHRGLSHSWLLGPLTRLAYLAILLVAASFLLSPLLEARSPVTLTCDAASWRYCLLAASGYFLSQWLHLILDSVGWR